MRVRFSVVLFLPVLLFSLVPPAPAGSRTDVARRPDVLVSFDLVRRVETFRDTVRDARVLRYDGWRGTDAVTDRRSRDKIFRDDDRFPPADASAYPWRTVCKVSVSYPSGATASGSGVMVDSMYALTAGHLVYNHGEGGWAESITVVPGYASGFQPYGMAGAANITTFTGWSSGRDPEWDVGIVELDSSLGDLSGWLGLWGAPDDQLLGEELTSGGYPGDLNGGEDMTGASGTCAELDAYRLYYADTFDTASGQDGGGVWLTLPGNNHYVVGIHTGDAGKLNHAVRINPEKFNLIYDYMGRLGELPDFRARDASSDLTGEVAAQDSGTVQFTVENEGGAAADAFVEVEALTLGGVSHILGSETRAVGSGGSEAFSIGVALPAAIKSGPLTINVHVNRSQTVAEADYGDNMAIASTPTVMPPWQQLVPGQKVKTVLDFGEIERFQLTVPANGASLKIKFKGGKTGTFELYEPSGTPVPLVKGKATIANPASGVWVLVMSRPAGEKKNKYGLKTKLKMLKIR